VTKRIPIPKVYTHRKWIHGGAFVYERTTVNMGFLRALWSRTYLCEITVTPVLDKRGRPITRRVK